MGAQNIWQKQKIELTPPASLVFFIFIAAIKDSEVAHITFQSASFWGVFCVYNVHYINFFK
jgi:hypothetical protein